MASRKAARKIPGSKTTTKSPASHGAAVPRAAAQAAKTSARSTASGPAHRGGAAAIADAATAKAAGTQAVAAAFPFNAAKPSEFGEHARKPALGQTVEPPHPTVSGSTLTESNASEKAGSGKPQAGFNPGNASLDRVRVDSAGRALTTNQG